MIARLVAFLLLDAALLAGAFLGIRRIARPLLERRRLRLLGERNAEMICGGCGQGCDPTKGDVLDGKHWYHRPCRQALLGMVDVYKPGA